MTELVVPAGGEVPDLSQVDKVPCRLVIPARWLVTSYPAEYSFIVTKLKFSLFKGSGINNVLIHPLEFPMLDHTPEMVKAVLCVTFAKK